MELTRTTPYQQIPREVHEALGWYGVSRDSRFAIFPKDKFSRGGAWALMPVFQTINNPWRKAHTENFWVWFSTSNITKRKRQ